MAARPSRLLRHLWRQDVSAYVPPTPVAGIVAGYPLLRHYDATVSPPWTSAGREKRTTTRDGARRLGPPPTGGPRLVSWPSRSPPLVVEHVSEGTPLSTVTPCDARDVRDCLDLLEASASVSTRAAEARRRLDAAHTLRRLAAVLLDHTALLAGAESLQTGLPLGASRRALTETAEVLQRAAAALASAETMPLSSPPPPGPTGRSRAAEDAATDRLEAPHGGIVVGLTGLYHSLACGVRAAAEALVHEKAAHVVWRPSPGALLAAQWLILLLARGTGAPGALRFHVLLLGAVETHLFPPLVEAAGRGPAGRPGGPRWLTYGCPPAETAALRRALPRGGAGGNMKTMMIEASVWRPRACAPSRPAVAILATSAGETAGAAAEVSLVEWIVRHGLARPPLEEAEDPARTSTRRVSLLWVPHGGTAGLLRRLVRDEAGVSRRLGHSLDPTATLGPLSSSAHRACVAEVLQRAATASPRVLWRHVCGGFDVSSTAPAGAAAFVWPTLLHATLPAGSLREAVRHLCRSTWDLLEPLERSYGGPSGAVLCFCSYEASSDEVAAAVAEVVAEEGDYGMVRLSVDPSTGAVREEWR